MSPGADVTVFFTTEDTESRDFRFLRLAGRGVQHAADENESVLNVRSPSLLVGARGRGMGG